MKKLRYFIVVFLMLLAMGYKVYTTDAASIPVGSSGLTYQTCIAFADVFKSIPTSSGSYYYKNCYRATCSNGVYNKANMVSNSGYRCQNGNYSPYTKISSDGCASYTGTCSTPNSTYCTRVTYIDCNRTSDGEAYETETTTTRKVTSRTTTTTKKTTTTTKKVFTTVKTTSKKSTTTKKKTTTTTTKFQPGVIRTTTTTAPITESTTTTTTTVAPTNDVRIKKIVVADDVIQEKDKSPLSNTEYDIQIPFGVEEVEIKVTLVDKKATYKVVGNTDMPDTDDHTIQIEVTAADGETKGVTVLNVIRYELKDNNCYAHDISSEDVNFEYSKKVKNYEVTIGKNVSSIDLQVAVANDKQTYEIKGNEKLKNNSKIEVAVKAEDGTVCLYTIKVKKPSNAWKYIIIIVLLIGAICAGVYFFFKYMKKSKGTYKYE